MTRFDDLRYILAHMLPEWKATRLPSGDVVVVLGPAGERVDITHRDVCVAESVYELLRDRVLVPVKYPDLAAKVATEGAKD